MKDEDKISVAIIGCGAAGLAALRHFTAEGSPFTCVSYEQTDNVGGTWVYTDRVGKDKYGLPVHSSMYKSLRYTYSVQFIRLSVFLSSRFCFQNEFAKRNHGVAGIPT